MKVAAIVGKFPVRSETFVKEHALGLARRGHQVMVMSCGPGEGIQLNELAEIDHSGIQRINIPCFGKNRIINLSRLLATIVRHPKMRHYLFSSPPWTRREMFWAHEIWRAILTVNPDVIHIHFGSKAGPLIRYRLPQHAVVTWHGIDANCTPRLRGETVYEELFKTMVHHTVGSSFMQQRLEFLGASSEYITQIPMGVDIDYFAYKKRVVSELNPLQIISVGRLDEMKGYTFLIQAVSELLNEGANIDLKIIGDGPLKESLNIQILNNQHAPKIRLLGSKLKHEVLSEMHAADLFCLTGVEALSGRVETQGVVFAEAQATGLPVIASEIGGVPESLIHGKTGLICPPGDVPAIKQAINFFLDNREAINKFGQEARHFVKSKSSLDHMMASFDHIYQLALSIKS